MGKKVRTIEFNEAGARRLQDAISSFTNTTEGQHNRGSFQSVVRVAMEVGAASCEDLKSKGLNDAYLSAARREMAPKAAPGTRNTVINFLRGKVEAKLGLTQPA